MRKRYSERCYLKRITKALVLASVPSIIIACGGSSGSSTSSQLQAPISGNIYVEKSVALLKKGLRDQHNTYYLQVASNSNISSITSTSSAWSATSSASCDVDDYKCLAVSIDDSQVDNYESLSTVLTIKYANGNTTELPLTASQVTAGSGIYMSLPPVITPNQDGLAYGVMTVFNSGDVAESLGDISSGVNRNATLEFIPNCDGNYGNMIESHSACSVSFVYKATQKDVELSNISVQVPLTPAGESIPTLYNLDTSSVKPVSTARIAYNGNGVSLASSDSTTFTIQNVGNSILSGITVENLPNGVGATNTCSNISTNAICSVTLNKSSDSVTSGVFSVSGGDNVLSISLAGQDLSVSPRSLNFGENYAGTSISKTITVSNVSAIGTVNNLGIMPSFNAQYSISSSTCSTSLSPLSSCQLVLTYTADNSDDEHRGSLLASADGNTRLSVVMYAKSLRSLWTNVITGSSTGYSDYNTDLNNPTVISAIGSYGSDIMFGNVNFSNNAAGRHVWLYGSNTFTNQANYGGTGSWVKSVPTAIADTNYGPVMVGSQNGQISTCENNTCTLRTGMSATAESERSSVTSIIPLYTGTESSAIFGLAMTTTAVNQGTSGKLMYWNGSESTPIPSITSGVGKMVEYNGHVYVPLASVPAQVVVIDEDSPNQVALTNTVSGLEAGEYFTVLYQYGGVLYAGTDFSNLYKTTLPLRANSSWTKINSSCLSGDCNEKEMPTMVTAIVSHGGSLYVALANPFGLTDFGAIYKYYINDNVIVRDSSYTDTYGVTGMTNAGSNLYVSSASGSIYMLQ